MRRYLSSITILILLSLALQLGLAADEQPSPFREQATKLLQQLGELSADGDSLQERIDSATGSTVRGTEQAA